MKSYNYESATHNELLEVVRWCQNHLSLRDWVITLVTSENPPLELAGELADNADTCGMSGWLNDDETGIIWLPLKRLEVLNVSPIMTCIHECIHCVMEKVGITNKEEYLVNLLSPIIYEAWMYDMQKMSKVNRASGRKTPQRCKTQQE